MPSYPGAVASFSTKVDNSTTVVSQHVNALQDEVVAIETALGTNPAASPNTDAVAYVAGTNTWSSVAARLQNLERGVVGDVHSQYVANGGGSLLKLASGKDAATVSLTLQAQTGQSGNLLNIKNAAGTIIGSIQADGTANLVGAVLDATSSISGTSAGNVANGFSAWNTAYTPTPTVLSLGSTGASAVGAYRSVGKTIHFRALLTLGTGFSWGAGYAVIPLPVASNGPSYTPFGVFGTAAGGLYQLMAYQSSSSTLTVYGVGSNGLRTSLSSTFPAAWAAGNQIIVSGTYEAV